MRYGSPDSNGKWVNGRPKYLACLPDPRASQNMTIKYLSVGQMSRFIYQQIALDVLFQMRYNSLSKSNKQPNDRLRAEATPCLHLTLLLLFLPASKICLNNLVSHSVTSWSRSGYHISFERGDPELSEGTKNLKFSNRYA